MNFTNTTKFVVYNNLIVKKKIFRKVEDAGFNNNRFLKTKKCSLTSKCKEKMKFEGQKFNIYMTSLLNPHTEFISS